MGSKESDRIHKLQRELFISQKRYEIAMGFLDFTSFDYDVLNKKIITPDSDFETFGIPPFVGNSVDDIIAIGCIDERSREDLRAFYKKIDNGSPGTSAIIYTHDKTGLEHVLELRIVTIFDDNGKPVYAVGIRNDVSGPFSIRKKKEETALEEQYYYESMVSMTDALYEFNVTDNLFITPHDEFCDLFNIVKTNDYSKLLNSFCEKVIHPQDRDNFKLLFLRQNLIDEYSKGISEVSCEYRRLDDNGEFSWFFSTVHLFEEPLSGAIKAYAYVNNIDSQKKEQLALIYKSQHDSLTGLYNKATVEEKISDFLSRSDSKIGSHAFFILDLDYFKAINDNFGHAFGDAFLSQAAEKIRTLFRDDDILGRIGGDEFVVLMKHVPSEKAAHTKAAELCAAVSETYMQNGTSYYVSSSIGIALYDRHGKTYDELYRNSDTALYYAKEHGRNQYAMYEKTMQFGMTSVKEIDSEHISRSRIFEENISEYVFRILYEASDKNIAINSVLELIGKHFNTSRVYIFENSADCKLTKNTFEWCNPNLPAQISGFNDSKYSALDDYYSNFNEDGYFYVPDMDQAPQPLKDMMATQGIKSMLQFSIMRNGKFVGFMGFDQCDRLRVPRQSELSECRNMANVIGIFIIEMRAIEQALISKLESDAERQVALSIANGFGSYAYVCNHDTHKILFMNKRVKQIAPAAKVGDLCYEAFCGQTKVCHDCPMESLFENEISSRLQSFSFDMLNPVFNMFFKVTASHIDWIGVKNVCLLDNVDITKYVK